MTERKPGVKTRSCQRPRKEGNPDLRLQQQSPTLEIPQFVEERKTTE